MPWAAAAASIRSMAFRINCGTNVAGLARTFKRLDLGLDPWLCDGALRDGVRAVLFPIEPALRRRQRLGHSYRNDHLSR